MNKKRLTPGNFIAAILLLMTSSAFPQKAGLKESVIEKFNKYVESFPREELYVNTDRSEYISGEELWLSVFLTKRKSQYTSADSRIAYVELLNPDNRPVIQKRILLDGNYGTGEADIPDSLSTGIYILRAYTNWMKNFLPGNCFSKIIRIYNPDNSRIFRHSGIPVKTPPFKDPYSISGSWMKVENSADEYVRVKINIDTNTLIETGNPFLLFVRSEGFIIHADYVRVPPGGATVFIYRNKLLRGINHFTLFNPAGVPVSEKFIYIRGEGETVSAEMPDEGLFRTGTLASASIVLSDKIKGPDCVYDISVVPAPGVQNDVSISEYMSTGSEFLPLLSSVPADSAFFEIKNTASSWIDWEKILKGKYNDPVYPVESMQHEITGLLTRPDNQLCPPGELVMMSVPSKTPLFSYATTDYKGEFSFGTDIDNSLKDLIIQPAEKSKGYRITMGSPFWEHYPERTGEFDSSLLKVPVYISDWSVVNQVRKIFELSSSQPSPDTISSPLKSLRFYGKPDIVVNMDDYIKLPNMEEVFFELVNFASLKKKKTGYEFGLVDPVGLRPFEGTPTTLLDGVVLNDPDKLAAMDPELVERIEVVTRKYVVGDCIFYGIINIITRKGNCTAVSLPADAIRLSYRTISPEKQFSLKTNNLAGTDNKHLPDFRNTLLWISQAGKKLRDSRVSFPTGDLPGKYKLRVTGMTAAGDFFECSRSFQIYK